MSLKVDNDGVMGLSPRGRGKHISSQRSRRPGGSIPAWAGETRTRLQQKFLHKVYPRVGGGNRYRITKSDLAEGLSPRGRGKRALPRHEVAQARSIPAWAGETRWRRCPSHSPGVYPRVGGGNRRCPGRVSCLRGLSPRGRGKPVIPRGDALLAGSIPAWAGETVDSPKSYSAARVYPRVGGGNPLKPSQYLRQ